MSCRSELAALTPVLSQRETETSGQPRDAVERKNVGLFFPAAELHDVGIFGRIVVKIAQHGDGLESIGAEEQLGRKVCLAHFKQDPAAALLRELADEFREHLRADSLTAKAPGDGEIQD